MKPIAVKLGAGALTILLGVFAATQAQKDRSNDNDDSWVAAIPPTLGQPPTPISADADSTPPSLEQRSVATADQEDSPFRSASVKLVQHTEAIESPSETHSVADDHDHAVNEPAAGTFAAGPEDDGSTIKLPSMSFVQPAPTGADESPSAAPDTITTPAWTLPAATADGGTTGSSTSSQPTGETPANPALAADQMPSMSMTLPGSLGETQRRQDSSSETRSPDLPTAAIPAMNVQIGTETNSADIPRSDPAAPPSASQLDGGLQNAAPEAESIDGQPANALRQAPGSFNPMRDSSASMDGDSPIEVGLPAVAGLSAAATAAAGLTAAAVANAGMPESGSPDASVPNPNMSFPSVSDAGGPSGIPTPSANGAIAPAGSPKMNIVSTGLGQPVGMTGPARIVGLPEQTGAASADNPAAPFEQPAAASTMALQPNNSTASPGDRRLEGIQSPSIVIHKRAPGEVKVGKPASFVIHIQNVGTVEALDVRVQDRVPLGMRLVDASPAPIRQGDMLLWQLGSMPAGDERTVTMQLVPEQEGELGSVARVTFEAAAAVRTISTRPELKIVQRAPEKVLIGQQLEIELEVSNPGSGEATGVILQEDVPDGLEHPQGSQLDNLLGTLAPGEVRRQILRLRAVAPGMIQNHIRLVGDDGLTAEHTVEVEVIAPNMKVGVSGPTKRFLERQATYQLEIANIGTADATNVEISVQLARGLTFISTGNEGQYDPSRHAVFWSLAELPEGGSGSVPLTVLPVEEGQQLIILEARADLGIVAKEERKILVDSIAELSFQITNPGGPIEVGSETTYEIRVRNSGSKGDTNVSVQLKLPAGLELVSSDADAETDGRGLVAFRPQPQLPPGEDIAYRVTVRGVDPGTHIVKAIVTSDQSDVPVTKEDSTKVYADQ